MGIVTVCAATFADEYATEWTCFGDFTQRLSYGLFLPMGAVCAATLVAVEGAGMMSRRVSPFPNVDKTQLLSAQYPLTLPIMS